MVSSLDILFVLFLNEKIDIHTKKKFRSSFNLFEAILRLTLNSILQCGIFLAWRPFCIENELLVYIWYSVSQLDKK